MLWEILKASKGILVADFYADLWANIAGGGTPVDIFVEMVGSLPLYYNGKGYDLTDYLISGNTVQDGTPSADAPVEVQGCGVRTGNLFDENYTNISVTIQYRPIYVGSGNFTLSTTIPYDKQVANIFLLSGDVTSGASTSGNGAWHNHNVTAQSVDGYVTIAYRCYSGTTSPVECQSMLNLGSTALPYEPYGYKLPLTVNGTEYPIYLGQVETTRRVKKLVLTGEESWSKDSDTGQSARYYITISDIENTTVNLLSSHFTQSTQYEIGTMRGYRKTIIFSVDKTIYATVTDWKSYLAAQYQNGTPVTVWYVLATPETAVVNEPLMKIGDYADTVNAEQAGVTIPTVSGANVLDMASQVKPSEVYIKGKGIKPTGYGQLRMGRMV